MVKTSHAQSSLQSSIKTNVVELAGIRDRMLTSHKILTLEEIIEVSNLYYGHEELLSLYGLKPKEYYEKGIRILGKTSIECIIDTQSIKISEYIKQIKNLFFPEENIIFLDLFLGSGNLLYHASKSLDPLLSVGIELNKHTYEITKNNLKLMRNNSRVYRGDSLKALGKIDFPKNKPIMIFLAPPWGEALSFKEGLDLEKTKPSINEIICSVINKFPNNELLFLIQVYKKITNRSLANIMNQFSYAKQEIIPAAVNENLDIGLLICTNEEIKSSFNQSKHNPLSVAA